MTIIKDERKREQIVKLLTNAYWSEIETVMSYIAASVNLDGVRAEEVKKSLAADVGTEIGHAQRFGKRIKELYAEVPGSFQFEATQKSLQPKADSTDVQAIIRGVIEAEQDAVNRYTELIEASDGVDYVTQDMAIEILADEESHLREFEGFLREYAAP